MASLPLEPIKAALAGRYAVERELGQGGMAVVLLARDERHGRQVALKLLRPELAAVLGTERFLREIEVAAALAHPHILPLLDSGRLLIPGSPEIPYYVMPLVEGESLRERLARGPLEPGEAVRLTAEIADALDCAHRAGVVHRDIKPDNILLQHGHAVVSDFGIARAVSAATGVARLTETGMSLGTRGYMSPEQFAGLEADHRSDIYSLGCVAAEMLTGHPPGPGGAALSRRFPAPVRAAVTRALAPLPADRWESAVEFARAMANGTARDRTPPLRLAAGILIVAVLATTALLMTTGRAIPWHRGDSGAEAEIDRARELINDGSAPHVIDAVNLLNNVVRRDSTNTRAWTGLATAYSWSQRHGVPLPGVAPESIGPLAVRFSEQALRIDSLDSDAWLARGWVDEYLDPARKVVALRSYQRATEIDSTNAEAWGRLGTVLSDMNRDDEALVAYRQASRFDQARHAYKLAIHFFFNRQFDSASVWADSTVAVAPDRYWSRLAATYVMLATGDLVSAEIHATAARRLETGAEVAGTTALAQLAARRGDSARARQLIAEAIAKTDPNRPPLHNPIYIGLALVSLGEYSEALDWLERYELTGDVHYQIHLQREPGFDPLRGEPRFRRLIRSQPA